MSYTDNCPKNGDTDNVLLQKIAGSLCTGGGGGGGGSSNVNVLSIAAGTTNIGDVDIASIAAGNNNIGDVDIASMPALAAGNNNIGDVDIAGAADPGNSTVTPLGIGGTFTGAAFDTLNYASAVFSITSDQASSANGFILEWGPDGVNWDVSTIMSLTALQTRGFNLSHRGRFFRIRYINGAVAQTTFRLNTSHRPASSGIISRTITENLFDDSLVHTTRAAIVAKRTDLSYANIRSNNNDRLLVSGESTFTEDSVHATGDVGTFVLGVRNDAAAVLTSASGDYSPIGVDEGGRVQIIQQPSSLVVTATAAANTGLTLTLPAPGGARFQHITFIRFSRTATAVLLGTSTLVVTTTNLPGALAFSVGDAMSAGGTQVDFSEHFGSSPLKAITSNTAVTFVFPAPGAAVLWRCTVFYYTSRLLGV